MNILDVLKLPSDSLYKFLTFLGLLMMFGPFAGAVWVLARAQEKVSDYRAAMTIGQGRKAVLGSKRDILKIDGDALMTEQRLVGSQMDIVGKMPDSKRRRELWESFGPILDEHKQRATALVERERAYRLEVANELMSLEQKQTVSLEWVARSKAALVVSLSLALNGLISFGCGLFGWACEQVVRDLLLRKQIESNV